MCPTPTASAHLPDGLILVVEDDPLILEFLCEILQEEGFKVEPQTSADAASLYLEQNAPNVALLLTDITMPGTLNGADLANLVGDRWPDKPVMVMSGYETPETSGVKHPVAFIKKAVGHWPVARLRRQRLQIQGTAPALTRWVNRPGKCYIARPVFCQRM